MRLRLRLCAVTLPLLIALSTLLPKTAVQAAGDTYSAWAGTDGDGRIQYRWYTYGGGVVLQKCSYQLRNLDSSDTKRYDSSIDYMDSRGNSNTKDGPFLDRTYHENSGNIVGCTSISGVTMRVR